MAPFEIKRISKNPYEKMTENEILEKLESLVSMLHRESIGMQLKFPVI